MDQETIEKLTNKQSPTMVTTNYEKEIDIDHWVLLYSDLMMV